MKKTADGCVTNLTKVSARNSCKLWNQTFAVAISTAIWLKFLGALIKELFLPSPFSYSFAHFPNLWCVINKVLQGCIISYRSNRVTAKSFQLREEGSWDSRARKVHYNAHLFLVFLVTLLDSSYGQAVYFRPAQIP
jgi:hypothetical protein